MSKHVALSIAFLFVLALRLPVAGSTSKQNNGRYLEAGIENDRGFQKWFRKFQTLVKAEDREKVAAMMHFPLDVRLNKIDRKIRDKKEFLSIYSQLFTKELKDIVVKQTIRELVVSDKGVRVGNGEVWINAFEGKPGYWITAVNN